MPAIPSYLSFLTNTKVLLAKSGSGLHYIISINMTLCQLSKDISSNIDTLDLNTSPPHPSWLASVLIPQRQVKTFLSG